MGKFSVQGLSEDAVSASAKEHGTNHLDPPDTETFWEKLQENFQDPLIHILSVALGITVLLAFLGYAEWFEGVGIATAVFLATFVATWSEFKNESTFQELQQQAGRVKNNVFRDGKLKEVFVGDIVVGDSVLLEAGNKIPADGQIVHGDIFVVQRSLTGENDPLRKTVAPKDYEPQDAENFSDPYLCFRGATVDEGEAVMVVNQVGVNSYYGRFLQDLNTKEDRETPLQVKLSVLADGISTIGYIGATFIALSFLFKQFVMDNAYNYTAIIAYVSQWQVALHDVVNSCILAIIVIVVAVPEGLPMMIAIVLSLNMRKLLKNNVLVRKLLGIETAGSINVLFADKTGTLTKGEFSPHVFVAGDVQQYHTYEAIPSALQNMLAFSLRESVSSSVTEEGVIVGGNASDRALLSFLDISVLSVRSGVTIVKESLFNSKRKFSATELAIKSKSQNIPASIKSKNITLIKGAPEIILANTSQMYNSDGSVSPISNPTSLTQSVDNLSHEGVRVIAIATSADSIKDDNTISTGLVLVGIIGVKDELRPETKIALATAEDAGIQVIMITGDKKETACAVGREIGLLTSDDDVVITSKELHTYDDEKMKQLLPKMKIIARSLPTDKSRLVRLAQQLGNVVAMTGDGVNDSSALKAADVGFAMGSGAEVAKEAADIVILDDNFLSITQAVLYGRTIFKSIRKFIIFQSTVNLASFLPVFFGPFLGFDFPLTLIQLLWVNLVMDTLAALAFGGESALPDSMKEKPIERDVHIVNWQMWSSILSNGIFIGLLSILFLKWDFVIDLFVRDGKPSEPVFLTAFFAFFIFMTNFNAFNVRTTSVNLFSHMLENGGFVGVVTLIFFVQIVFTYLGGSILRTVALTLDEWLMVIGASFVIIPFDILRKLLLGSSSTTSKEKKE